MPRCPICRPPWFVVPFCSCSSFSCLLSSERIFSSSYLSVIRFICCPSASKSSMNQPSWFMRTRILCNMTQTSLTLTMFFLYHRYDSLCSTSNLACRTLKALSMFLRSAASSFVYCSSPMLAGEWIERAKIVQRGYMTSTRKYTWRLFCALRCNLYSVGMLMSYVPFKMKLNKGDTATSVLFFFVAHLSANQCHT